MPDPIPTQEMHIPQQIVVGETPLYLKTPIKVGDTEVTSVVIQSSDKRSPSGVESSVLMVREPSRKKGEEGKIIDKPVIHVDTMDQMAWDKISGIQWTDEAGVAHIIPKEALALEQPAAGAEPAVSSEPSPADAPADTQQETPIQPGDNNETPKGTSDVSADLTPPDESGNPAEGALPQEVTEPPLPETEIPQEQLAEQPEAPQEEAIPATPTPSKEARKVLETLTEDPNTITIVGLRAYETRALDLADRAMQKMTTPQMTERAAATKNLWDKTKEGAHAVHEFVFTSLWKQSIGGIYFHERAREYYMDMLKTAETPFAEQSIRLAEARATERYNKKLNDANFIVRAGTKAIDWLKDKLGMRSAIQNMALEEIGVMKAAGELKGAEIFEREAKAVRMRFSQDMDKADQFVRTQLGEKLEILDATKEEHKPLVEGIQGLLKQYATGEIADKTEFDKRTKEFFNATLKNVRPDVFAEAELYSSSLFDAAEMLRNKMSHEAGLANIDQAMSGLQIRLGLGAMGEVTSLEPTAVERGIGRVREVYEWLNKKNVIVPMVFNEATIGSGVAIALSALNFLKTTPFRIIGGPIGNITGGALAGGVFAGWKEYGQLQKDYLTHLREREAGTQFTDTMKRRAWFERFSVKQRSANEMMHTMQSSLYETPADGGMPVLKTTLTDDELRTAFATVADLHARKAISEVGPKRIGLVQYSSREGIESERAALDIMASNVLNDLSHLSDLGKLDNVLGGNAFPEFMEKLTVAQTQILKDGIGKMDSFDDPVKATLGFVSQYAPEADMIKRRWPFAGRQTTPDEKAMGMDAILAEFNNEARLEAVKYGVKAGVIGAAVGAAIQGVEALAHNAQVTDAVHTATQHAKDTIQNSTEPATFSPISTRTETVPISPPSADHTVLIGNQTYQLPKEIDIVQHVTGGPDERVVTYDAAFHVNGPVHDITLGHDMSPQQLTDTLHNAGLHMVNAHPAGEPGSFTYDSPTIPNLTAPAGVDRLAINLPPDYTIHYVPDHHDWQILDPNHTVVTTVKFDGTGNFQGTPTELQRITDQLHAHGLDWKSTNVHTASNVVPASGVTNPDVLPSSTVTEPMTISGGELGKGGVWDYFLGKTNNVSEANAFKNMFRMYAHDHMDKVIDIPNDSPHANFFDAIKHPENFRHATFGDATHGGIGPTSEMDLSRIPNDATIHVDPKVFGPDGIKEFVRSR